jgi:transposase
MGAFGPPATCSKNQRSSQDPQSTRYPRCNLLLRLAERLPLTASAPQLPTLEEHRLPLLPPVAHQRHYLRAAKLGAALEYPGPTGHECAPQRRDRGLAIVGKEDLRCGRVTKGLRRWQEEDARQETPPAGGHRGPRAQGEGRQRKGARPGQDRVAGGVGARSGLSRLKHLWLDAGYEGRGKRWAEEVLGLSVEVVRKLQKPTPEKVAKIWAGEWAKEGKEEVDYWQRLMPPRGFRVLPRRWMVERTFSWLSQNRRMSRDYERLCVTGEAFIYVAMIRLMVRRLSRA